MTPITLEFELPVSPEHAFEVWTRRCSLWWPRSHRMGGDDGAFEVVFEPRVGGRIFERGSDGVEHEWGEVTVWDPPVRLDYRWHIFLDRDQATTVSISFTGTEAGVAVRLVNEGFEIFGEAAAERFDRVGGAWSTITSRYRAAV